MDASDTVKPPAQIYYPCLPDVQRYCTCTPADVAAGRDCGGLVVKPPKRRQ